jgi:hypothetical protein
LWRKVALYAVAGGTLAVVLCVALVSMFTGQETPVAVETEAVAEIEPMPPETIPPGTAGESESSATTETATKPSEVPDSPLATESLLPAAPAAEQPIPVASVDSLESKALNLSEAKTPATQPSNPAGDSPRTSAVATAAAGSAPPFTVAETESTTPLDAARLLADASLETLLPGEAPSPDAALIVPVKEMSEAELRAAAAADDSAEDAADAGQSGSSENADAATAAVRRIPSESNTSLQPAEEILRLQLPQITFHKIPLALLLSELSDLSTLPMSFDLSALSAAQISPDVLVSVSAIDKTLAEILASTLASQKLTYYTEQRQVIVTTPSSLAAPRTVKFSVDDLATGEEKLRELAALIVKTVAPESWQFAGGPGKIQLEGDRLSLEQSGSVIYEAVIFCERLRTARGLATRSRLTAEQLQLKSARVQSQSHLARKVSCTFHAPTRLAEVVRYLEELSGAKIFIDWRSLAQAHLSPQDTISCALPEQSLSSALDALLPPLGLSYRVLDKNTLEIFAQQDLPNKMTREFYSLQPILAAGVKLEVLLSGIRQLTGEQAWAPETTSLLYYDPASEYLIVRHGNRIHAQIEHLLTELTRKLAAKKVPSGKG